MHGARRRRAQLADLRGTFGLHDKGTLAGTTVPGTWFVVPGSGTGELQGLRGDGGFVAQLGGGAEITLDYWFE